LALLAGSPVARAQAGVPADLEEPDWDGGEDHPAQLEHAADVAPEPQAEPEGEPQAEPEGEPQAEPEGEPQAEPEGEPQAEPEGEPQAEPEGEPQHSERYQPPTLLELGGTAGLLYQQLRYRDDLYGFMRPYNLDSAKQFGGYVTAYPLARAGLGALGGLGVELRYAHMLAFDSLRADGSSFPTRARELVAGFRYRFHCDALRDRGVDASVGVGGGGQVFDIGSAVALADVDNRAAVPSRHYRFLRVDAATRVALDLGFFVSMHIGVRVVTDAGDVGSTEWFPHGRSWGLESGLHLGYELPKGIELSLGFEAQRYMFRLRPEPGDANIVGGLLDRYVHAQLRAGWRY
jgi:hypothetical protein